MAAMYAIYHGPAQLRNMAIKNVLYARAVGALFTHYGHEVISTDGNAGQILSDTVTVKVKGSEQSQRGLF
ncbi:hypothetical protein LVA97_32220, partial [Klebsiella pneumoniae]|nr:hypothetical protein [Klebsiella pneumoniae]